MQPHSSASAPAPLPLGLFSIVFITVVSVDSVRNLPTSALFGPHLLAMFTLATLAFLIPCSLITAELASTRLREPQYCGIYGWFKEAFGPRIACWGVWLQWIENAVWYPTMLSYIAGTLGYLVDPAWAHHKIYLFVTMLTILWTLTGLNLCGIKNSVKFSHFCTLFGLFLPMALIIGYGAYQAWQGKPPAFGGTGMGFTWPAWDAPQTWVGLTGIMLSFCGMELATVHGNAVLNPQKTIPRAMGIAVLIIASTLLAGALAIAWVIPTAELSLLTGMMQAFSLFFGSDHPMALLLLGLMLVLGALGGLNNWILAPCESLLQISRDGHLPRFWGRTNRAGAPYVILLIQAVIVTSVACCFLWIPSVNASYWFLGAMTSQIYMMMYVLLFAAALKLRWTHRERAFQIPGGYGVLFGISGLGIFACLLTIGLGFIPPSHVFAMGDTVGYGWKVAAGLSLFVLPGLFVFTIRRTPVAPQQA